MRVALLDNQPIIREGLRLLIERNRDLVVVDQWSSLEEISPSPGPRPTGPQVVVTDLVLPDGGGGRLIRELRRRLAAAVVVLSAARHPAKVQEALDAGALGYVLRTAAPSDLLGSVQAASRGEPYLQPALGMALAHWSRSSEPDGRARGRLSTREEAVLRLVALGHTNGEIARLMGVSLRTVESHRTGLVRKLGRKTRAELVRVAAESGLIELRP